MVEIVSEEVSDKDRRAAEHAGTDESKPAGLKPVKEVFDKWKLDVTKVLPVPEK